MKNKGLLTLILFTATMSAQRLSQVDVTSGRPVAEALDHFELLGSIAIHYEDVRFENASDIEDVSEQVRKPNHVGETRRVLVPVNRTLTSSFVVDQNGKLADSLAVEQAVQALLAANDAASTPGRYRIDRYGEGDIFVIPTHVRNIEGDFKPNTSVLATPISVVFHKTNAGEALQRVLEKVSEASGQQVQPGVMPYAALANSEITLSAQDEPAGYVLAEMLKQTGGVFSVRMFYGPDVKYYALNIQPVRGAIPKPETSPPPGSKSGSVGDAGRSPWTGGPAR